MKNRQLKGRSTSGMSDAQKEAWAYSKNNITTDKKSQMEALRVANDKKVDTFQASAEATRKRISEKIKLLSEKLTKEAEARREEIADKLEADIENVAPIPKGISEERRAILVERRNKKIADIREASSKYANNRSSDTKEAREKGADEASGEREKTRNDLKAIISSTRDAYSKAKTGLIAEYETTYQREYDKVLSTVAGKPKKPKKGKKPPKEKQGKIIYYNGKGPTR